MAVDTAVEVNHPGFSGLMRVRYTVAADSTLVAAQAGKTIRVVGGIMAALAGNTSLESNTTEIFGAYTITAAPMVLPINAAGYCETAAGEALNLELSATDLNTGVIFYVVV